MSLINQKKIAAKIKSIDQNFVPKLEVDSRTTPRTDDELQFMANLVIALNGKIAKVFFDRRVKNYSYSNVHVGYYGDDFELILNMHRLAFSVEELVEMVDRSVKHMINHRDGFTNTAEALAQRDAFDAAIDSIGASFDYEEEEEDRKIVPMNRNVEVVINGVNKTVNYSTLSGYPTVSYRGDADFDADEKSVFKILSAIGDDVVFPVEIDSHGAAWFVYESEFREMKENEMKEVEVKEEIAVNEEITVNEEVTVNEEIAVNVTEMMTDDEVFAKTDRMVEEMKNMGIEFDFVKETSKAVIEKFIAGNKLVNMDLEASATEVYNACVAHFSKSEYGMTFGFNEVGLIFASIVRNEYP